MELITTVHGAVVDIRVGLLRNHSICYEQMLSELSNSEQRFLMGYMVFCLLVKIHVFAERRPMRVEYLTSSLIHRSSITRLLPGLYYAVF